MRIKDVLYTVVVILVFYTVSTSTSGCAQIGAPTGGPRDSIAPQLVSATPKLRSTSFSGNKISLNFDEYIDIRDIQNNLLVSPYPKNNPTVEFKLKTVSVKLKDSLLPNTTYSINFGNAIVDNNEGNPFKNFTYVFSTGNTIDSLQLKGKVVLAETGKTDSTLIALLYRDVPDSIVRKRKPDYITRLAGDGAFSFSNLSAGLYKLYALKDGDGSKTYNSPTELFAFLDSSVTVSQADTTVTIYAYAEEKDKKAVVAASSIPGRQTGTADKKLKYSSSILGTQDLLSDLQLTFNKPLKSFDPQKIILADTNFKKIPAVVFSLDTTSKIVTVKTKWTEGFPYRLIIQKEAFADSAGTQLSKTDTLRFTTKSKADYGNLLIRFKNIGAVMHPVLQFTRNEEIVKSLPINRTEWNDPYFIPGEYELRILYDTNNNGQWDPGNYSKKLQPEKAITLDRKLSIKADWDNEREISL